MTKLLQNKPIIKFLGIALSILLIVALVPQIKHRLWLQGRRLSRHGY